MSHAAVTDLGFFGNIYARQLVFTRAGDHHPGERHYFDHISLVVRGSVRVDWRDEAGVTGSAVYSAGTDHGRIPIPADRWHTVTALEPQSEAWCLFAVRDTTGEVVMDRQGVELHPYFEGSHA